jgi:hypothetical protein
MANRGYKLTKSSWKDRKFQSHLIFGVAEAVPDTYNVDDGSWFPDQDKDNRPTECTAYLVTDSARDHTGVRYSEDFNFMKTLVIMNAPANANGADLRSAYMVAPSFGLLERDNEPGVIEANPDQSFSANYVNWPIEVDHIASKNKKAFVTITGPYDFSSNAQSFMWQTKERRYSVGVGTTWYAEFERIGSDGVLPDNPKFATGGHAYKLCGWKLIDGQKYWVLKTWQGPTYGDNGYCYMSFPLMNRLVGALGAARFALVDMDDTTYTNLKQQNATFQMVLMDVMRNLLITLKTYVQLLSQTTS